MCKGRTRSVLVSETETVLGFRKHTLKPSTDMRVSVFSQIWSHGDGPILQAPGSISARRCHFSSNLMLEESVVQAKRTACAMDHENKPEHEVQFSWVSSWNDVRMQKHLLLRDWDTIARLYMDKAVGLGKRASYSSAPLHGASQELTVS